MLTLLQSTHPDVPITADIVEGSSQLTDNFKGISDPLCGRSRKHYPLFNLCSQAMVYSTALFIHNLCLFLFHFSFSCKDPQPSEDPIRLAYHAQRGLREAGQSKGRHEEV